MEQRFIFHAQALGLAGRLSGQNFVHGIAALAPHGGNSTTRLTNIRESKVSAGYICSKVDGFEESDAWITKVSVSIEELNLFGCVKADLLSASIRGVWTKGEKQPIYTLDGLAYEGLKADGVLVLMGQTLDIPGFGTLYTGERLETDKMLRFSLFRLKLEPGLRSNEDGGEVGGGDVVGNGHTYPP